VGRMSPRVCLRRAQNAPACRLRASAQPGARSSSSHS
jgi:hypothetical protein